MRASNYLEATEICTKDTLVQALPPKCIENNSDYAFV